MEIKINKEIRDYKETIFFGLSMRQFVFSAIACAVAVLLYFILKPHFSLETISWVCILGAVPFAVLGFVKYNGLTAEQFISAFIKSEILMPKVLLFKPENIYYESLKNEIKQREKEELKIENTRKNIKSIIQTKGQKQNSKECTTSNTNSENIRRWHISSWEE